MNDLARLSFDIRSLRRAYAAGVVAPEDVVHEALRRIDCFNDRNACISLRSEADLIADARALAGRDPASLPLYGVPFAIKDNIDYAQLPTTAACPEFAYQPERSAFVVDLLIAAGAIPLGKTNLDQFAAGLNGTRVPEMYGICRNSFDPAWIAGGSSSGSAVAVALGMAGFALGTDTAGSGRIPAAFNNLLGLKPTRGVLSCRGVVPACRSLDCVSVFALTAADAARVFETLRRFDAEDPYARPWRTEVRASAERFCFGVPRADQIEFFGNTGYARLFKDAVCALESLGGEVREIDLAPLMEAARLLYEGPWIAERYCAIRDLIETRPGVLHPVTRAIIEPAASRTAVEAFEARYRLQALKRRSEEILAGLDCVVTPTAPTIYRIEDMLADPIALNSRLGHYTNFINLLDLAAVAVPAGFDGAGLPFGITLFAPAFSDFALLGIAHRLQQALKLPLGATGVPCPVAPFEPPPGAEMAVVVCGAHMSGLPLNSQLTDLGGRLIEETHTAPRYRLCALTAMQPVRPGLLRDEDNGDAIEVEVWGLPIANVGALLAQIPAPLGLGRVELADGRFECGFLCEPYALGAATDITALGGWRAFLAAR